MQTADQSILIIEHDDPTRELYVRELTRDYHVFACSEVHEALALLRTHDIDAIVLEPAGPKGHGWQSFAEIQAANLDRSIPVVLCSTLDERSRGAELGASAYLVKPVLPKTLLETLHRLLVGQNQP
jgi:DNA-binding response OmpR family regulator